MVMSGEPSKRKPLGNGLVVGMVVAAVAAVGGLSYYFIAEPDKASHQPAAQSSDSVVRHKAPSLVDVAKGAVLKIESSPAGAQVFVDGSFKGKSPLDLDLSIGKHEVRLNLPDHYEWEAQLQMKEEGETPLFVRLIPME
jgi:hypothetical protein